MKSGRLLNLALAALVGAGAGLPAKSNADDTEIYLGDVTVSEGVRPNVLFILDTSGSMSAFDGQPKDRLGRMKEALHEILDEANNINVGLMRFTDPGGPILFPVSYIDEDVSVVEAAGAGSDVRVQVAASADDAEEFAGSGSVDLLGDHLELVEATASTSGSTLVTRNVASQSNNAEQRLGDGDVITQNQIDMNSEQTNAVRFQNVAIPPGATILDARIVFTARNSDSSATTLIFHGEANVSPSAFPTSCSGCNDVSARSTTSASVSWSPPSWSSGNEYATDDLSAIVQEIVGLPGWSSGNSMVFVQSHGGSGQRRAYTYQGSSSRAARLEVTYATTVATGDQVVGLRFQNVGIPQGATITRAVLELWPATTSSEPADVVIQGQADDDAPAFAGTSGDLSGRAKTSASVAWSAIPAWDDVDTLHQTPDLAAIVQEIVARPGWCGNNAMAFLLAKGADNGPRIAESFDHDPSRSPVLRVDYDESSVGADACINQWVQRQVEESDDDAEETVSSGSVSVGGSSLDMRSSQVNAMRFQDIPVPQGAEVVEARLVFTARSTRSGASQLRFSAQDADDAPGFSSSSDDISARTRTSAFVDWNPDDWDAAGEQHTSADLASVVQEVIDRPAWVPGNSIVIVQEHVSGEERNAHTYNGNPAAAPRLLIKVRGALSTGGSGFKSVRARLREIVDEFDHKGHTPIVDTLYEAARYFRGDAVHWGLTRGFDRSLGDFNAPGTNDDVRRNTRLSHPSSYTGGSVFRDPGCTEANLNAAECITETIVGDARYVSPITESCQANHIVLLTDGMANHNDSENFIKSYIPVATCMSADADERCARDLVEWMHTADQSGAISGDQLVSTHTIGFNFSDDFLRDLAALGGGKFYEASTATELANVFKTIIADILARTTSFAAPSLSVNAFNRLFHRNEVYFSLFKPDERVSWTGNVKKYALCESEADGCSLGEVLDAAGAPAIGADNRIRDEAESFWSGSRDGAEVDVGGAGNRIPDYGLRRVFTYTGAGAPSGAPLDSLANTLATSNADVTKELLGDPVMSDADRTDLIEWIRGKDVDDEDGDGETDENRYAFHDPLHSSPVAVTYGGTDADPVIKLFIGTNDGAVRMLNARNGAEEWIFYPQETLAKQGTLRANPAGDHVYGVDGTPTVWVNDEDLDGVVDPRVDADGDGAKEFVRVFVGMRRGGENYYAIDATPPEITGPLTDPERTSDVSPRLLWRIEGDSTDFPRLGQSWSRPKLATLRVGTTTAGESIFKNVLVFAGGYDPDQDTSFGAGGLGNAIYVVDPSDGSRIFWVSATDHGDSEGVVVPDMVYPVPSDVALMDANGDGAADRLYVGDTGGQVWRVDFDADLTASAGIEAVVGKLATVSDGTEVADRRKFFYPPDVVQVNDLVFSDAPRYDMVTIASGNRAHPLGTDVLDRFYAFRDLHVAPLVDGDPLDPADDDGLADGYTTLQGKTTALAGDLFDATAISGPTGEDLTDLRNADGFFIDLTGIGEKALAAPVVLAGTVFFTTYLPEGVVSTSSCALAEGAGTLYAFSVLSGTAVYDWDASGEGDGASPTVDDRLYALGGGIPSAAVPIFSPEGITLLVGGGGGAATIDPDIGLPRKRSFWYPGGIY